MHTRLVRFGSALVYACIAVGFVLSAATAAQAQQTVTATWDRNTDAYTAGYRLFYGTSSGTYQWSVDVGNVTSAPLTLSTGSYYFAVRAYNASYEYGPPSNEATFTIGGPAPPTAAIQATLQAGNVALVAWQTTNAVSATINGTTVAVNGSTTIAVSATTTFTIVARSASGATATASATVTVGTAAPTAAIQATLISANTARVSWQTTNAVSAAINGVAVGATGSETVTVTTTTTFTLVARSASGATATANATVTLGAATPTAAIQATLEGGKDAHVTWQTTNAVSATINGTAVALSGSAKVAVTAKTTFELVARNANGAVATATAVVDPGSTNRPPLAPVSVRASVSGWRVTLSWQPNASGGAPSEYLLYVGTTASNSNVVHGVSLGNVQSVSANLQRGTYYARLRARNAHGTSESSTIVSFRVGRRLATPTGLTAKWSGTQTTLSWVESAADSADMEPTDYVLEAGTAPGLADVAAVRLGRQTRFTADVPYGVYYVRVRAMNDGGESDPSPDLVVAAPGSSPAPSALSAGGAGATVSLSWSPPAGGAEPPTGYLIEAGSDPGLSDLATIRVANVTSFATEAPPGTYFVRVRAINSLGPGLPSNEVVVRK